MADGNVRGLDDEALRRLCLALAPLLACSLDLRSSGCEPRVPGETAARETPTERAIDAGQLAAARAAEARVIRCGAEEPRLRWLAEHGGPAATVASLSQCLAEQHGPIALREALPAACADRCGFSVPTSTTWRALSQTAMPGKLQNRVAVGN